MGTAPAAKRRNPGVSDRPPEHPDYAHANRRCTEGCALCGGFDPGEDFVVVEGDLDLPSTLDAADPHA